MVAAPAYVASATNAASSQTYTFPVPSGGQAGDLLVIFLTGPLAGPQMQSAGWTQYPAPPWTDGLFMWWKPWNGETSFTLGSLANCQATCVLYRNARTSGAPFGAVVHLPVASDSGGTSGTSRELPSVTVEGGNSLLVGYAAPDQLSAASATVEGMTVRAQALYRNGNGIVTSQISHVIADEGHAAAVGASDPRTVTVGNSSYTWGLTTLVLLPANNPPNAPAPSGPVGGANVDRTQPVPLAAAFSDPDPADSQSASKWRYRIVGAATWTTVTQNNTLQSYSIPAGLAAGDYEWQASYADQAGEWGPFCGSSFFTAIDPPPGPVWLDPISGQTITADTYTGVISQASLSESEWTLYADNAGAINEAVVLQGPVSVTSGDLRRHTFAGLANNTPVWWSVRTKDQGLWSQPVQERTPVAFTPPPTPTLTVAASDPDGAISVTVTNPAPGAGEPAVDYVDIYARCPSWTPGADQYRPYSEAGTRIASAKPIDSVLIDHLAASGVAYEYRAVGVAANGTTAASAWTSVDPAATPTIYYGGAY